MQDAPLDRHQLWLGNLNQARSAGFLHGLVVQMVTMFHKELHLPFNYFLALECARRLILIKQLLQCPHHQGFSALAERAQQRLLDLISIQPMPEVAIVMRRSPGSIRSMLHRLGASARMGQDWFTKYTLAEALHIRAEEVQRWISLGWLKCRVVHTGKLLREIIEADDFSEFCKAHSREVVGRRLNIDRLNFVKDFVFPPSHAELLPVRESKKERAAYQEQIGRVPQSDIDDERYDEGLATSA